MNADELKHYGVKGQKWGVRRYQNEDGSYKPGAKRRYNKDNEYDEERERHEKEVAARRGVEYVRKTKKEREIEDAEEERKDNERRAKEDAAYSRTAEKMKAIDAKLKAKYDFNSNADIDKYYDEYDKEWFKILYEERKKEGLSHTDMSSEELMHHGIKGQKWGRRRYQNKDGSLTPEGKKRYGDIGEKEFDDKYKAEQIGKLTNVKKAVDNNKTANDLAKYSESKRSKKQAEVDAATEAAIRDRVYKMSDDELRAAVNRINMEERYTQVMQQREHIEVGKTKTEKFMKAASNTLTLTSTALTIAIMIRELQK